MENVYYFSTFHSGVGLQMADYDQLFSFVSSFMTKYTCALHTTHT